jgi:hypothetical protein
MVTQHDDNNNGNTNSSRINMVEAGGLKTIHVLVFEVMTPCSRIPT